MTRAIRIAIVGMGKIAQDHHLPAIAANSAFELVATVSRSNPVGAWPSFPTLDDLAASDIEIDAVVLCTPPQVRRELAIRACGYGWHIFLEKPPASTLSEVEAMAAAAQAAGVTLFGNWHSRFAAGVTRAHEWLQQHRPRSARIIWREDVRRWHPGQDWLWEPGGFGVFDPGINALSIITHIWPDGLFVEAATLEVPANRAAPIASKFSLLDSAGRRIEADLDFRQEGPQSWEIQIDTEAGILTLLDGGGRLQLPGEMLPPPVSDLFGEYPGLYARFAELVSSGTSEVDATPLRLVADIFLRGHHVSTDPYIE